MKYELRGAASRVGGRNKNQSCVVASLLDSLLIRTRADVLVGAFCNGSWGSRCFEKDFPGPDVEQVIPHGPSCTGTNKGHPNPSTEFGLLGAQCIGSGSRCGWVMAVHWDPLSLGSELRASSRAKGARNVLQPEEQTIPTFLSINVSYQGHRAAWWL